MDDHSQHLMTLSSRERLLVAAMELFATQGYGRTTVGDIEARAGFTPRGGALYKHFDGKHAVLEAGIERHVERISELRRAALALPLGDEEVDLVLLLRWFLVELDEERAITAILEKEGDRFPELRDRFYERVIEPGLQDTATLVERVTGGRDEWDSETIATIVIGSLVNHRRNEWTFGVPPLGVSDEQLINTIRQLFRWVRKGGATGHGREDN